MLSTGNVQPKIKILEHKPHSATNFWWLFFNRKKQPLKHTIVWKRKILLKLLDGHRSSVFPKILPIAKMQGSAILGPKFNALDTKDGVFCEREQLLNYLYSFLANGNICMYTCIRYIKKTRGKRRQKKNSIVAFIFRRLQAIWS